MRILELVFHWMADLEADLDSRPATVRVVAPGADHPLATLLWENRRLCLCHSPHGPRLHRVLAEVAGVDEQWILARLRSGASTWTDSTWTDRLLTSSELDAALLRRALGHHIALTLVQAARLALDRPGVVLEVEYNSPSRRAPGLALPPLEVLTLAAGKTLEGVVEAGRPPTGFLSPADGTRRSLCFVELAGGRLRALPIAVSACSGMTLQESLGAYREARAAIAPAPLQSTGLSPDAVMMRRANDRGLVVFHNPPYLTTVETARPEEAVALLSRYLSDRPARGHADSTPTPALAPFLEAAVG